MGSSGRQQQRFCHCLLSLGTPSQNKKVNELKLTPTSVQYAETSSVVGLMCQQEAILAGLTVE